MVQSGPWLKHIWDTISGEILSMPDSHLSGNEAMRERGIDYRQFLNVQEGKLYGALRFGEKAVEYAFANTVHPGIGLVLDSF